MLHGGFTVRVKNRQLSEIWSKFKLAYYTVVMKYAYKQTVRTKDTLE